MAEVHSSERSMPSVELQFVNAPHMGAVVGHDFRGPLRQPWSRPRRLWKPSEDEKLKALVAKYGHRWNLIGHEFEERTGKSCRLRWFNQLDPNIKKEAFSKKEEEDLMNAHKSFGNKWSIIASLLPGRTDNAVKNQWRTIMARNRREERRCNGGGSSGAVSSSSTIQSDGKFLPQFTDLSFQNSTVCAAQFKPLNHRCSASDHSDATLQGPATGPVAVAHNSMRLPFYDFMGVGQNSIPSVDGSPYLEK